MREIENMLRRFDASLEWLLEGIQMRENEIETIKQNGEVEGCEKEQMLRAKKSKSIHDVLDEVEVLVDTHFFDGFSGTRSASFLNKLVDKQGPVDIGSSGRHGGH